MPTIQQLVRKGRVVLEDNIAKYERVFGSIRISDESLISPLASVKGEA